MKVHGWGRYPIAHANVLRPQIKSSCVDLIKEHDSVIAKGLGRSYGDSAISATILQSTYLDNYIEFDYVAGVLTCEAGVSIREILQLIVPAGWFIPVTPGTSYVTIGGAIASDVHGKNHHLSGTFSEHVLSFELMLGTGEVVYVSKASYPDLFRATCGGMGLTGVILSAAIKLNRIQSNQIIQTTIKASNIEVLCEQLDENFNSTYSVAWIDCMARGRNFGRSLLMLGEHAEDGGLEMLESKEKFNLSMEMPQGLLNTYSVRAFNEFYYHRLIAQKTTKRLLLGSYFYPLDAILNWNRLYGKAGILQYQFVLPKVVGLNGLRKILSTIVNSGKESFLAVLKVLGKANENYLSFPMDGYTLALDFKVSPDTIELIKRLDLMVVDMGGHVYLAKDAIMSEQLFKATYPMWQQFEQVRIKYGAVGKFSSNQSRRLGLQ